MKYGENSEVKSKENTYSNAHIKFIKKQRLDFVGTHLIRIALLILFIMVWELLTRAKIIDSFIFSSPSRILKMFIQLMKEGNLLRHTWVTLYETLIAFLVSTIIGAIIAIILFSIRKIRVVLEPYLIVLNSLPKVALGPLIIVWFGAGTRAIIVMGFLICIVITIITLLNSFLSTDKEKILLMKSMGASNFQILTKLVFPSSLPDFISLLKINVGMSWVGTIMGEYLVSKEGLGYLIVYGSYIFKLDLVMLSIIIICLLASLMYLTIAIIEKIFIKWKN